MFNNLFSGVIIIFLLIEISLSEQQFKPAEIDKKSILENHRKVNFSKSETIFPKLAYVTPWNKRGHKLAELTAERLTHISPVWFQAKPKLKKEKLHNCKIEGSHDIDTDWLISLRAKNQKIKIVPRIIFEQWTREDMEHFLIDSQVAIRCAKRIAKFYRKNDFDGAVIELWTQSLMSTQNLRNKQLIIEVMEIISNVLREKDLIVIYTVPAPLNFENTPNDLINPPEYQKIIQFADFVQIMTYDFHGKQPTGVAPYTWMDECINYLVGQNYSPKTLVGLNWYGYEYSSEGVDTVLGDRSSIIYYPSLTSLEIRIALARRYNSGIAIWDYGQGLNYFTNLLI